ncbi:hypothetical protein BJX99DRAFT_258632 [Aspergillus californicus]
MTDPSEYALPASPDDTLSKADVPVPDIDLLKKAIATAAKVPSDTSTPSNQEEGQPADSPPGGYNGGNQKEEPANPMSIKSAKPAKGTENVESDSAEGTRSDSSGALFTIEDTNPPATQTPEQIQGPTAHPAPPPAVSSSEEQMMGLKILVVEEGHGGDDAPLRSILTGLVHAVHTADTTEKCIRLIDEAYQDVEGGRIFDVAFLAAKVRAP